MFLIDFLNLYDEVINTYKAINNKKILVITKSDLIPKNIKKDTLIKKIKTIYKIDEDIIITSSKTKENINVLKEIIIKNKNVLICGFTNSGKSSLINTLANSTLTISKNANTTLDFLKIKMDEAIIYDSPGFISKNFYDSLLPKMKIRPISYQLKNKYYLKINDWSWHFSLDNNITLYLDNTFNVEKRKLITEFPNKIKVPSNSDVIIKGLGFMLVKKECVLTTNIDLKYLEIRPTIVGGENE